MAMWTQSMWNRLAAQEEAEDRRLSAVDELRMADRRTAEAADRWLVGSTNPVEGRAAVRELVKAVRAWRKAYDAVHVSGSAL